MLLGDLYEIFHHLNIKLIFLMGFSTHVTSMVDLSVILWFFVQRNIVYRKLATLSSYSTICIICIEYMYSYSVGIAVYCIRIKNALWMIVQPTYNTQCFFTQKNHYRLILEWHLSMQKLLLRGVPLLWSTELVTWVLEPIRNINFMVENFIKITKKHYQMWNLKFGCGFWSN